MAQTPEQLAQQELTLSSIRGIVRTMKALAAINAAPYEQAALGIEAYRQTIRRGFAAFAFRMGAQALRKQPSASRHVMVAFGSDHGFCGNYNEILARVVQQHCQARSATRQTILCIGAKFQSTLEEHGIEVDQRLMPPASVDGMSRLAREIVTRIENLGRGQSLATLEVRLAYTRRAALGSREAVVSTLLPLPPSLMQAPRRWPSPSLPYFSMAAEPLLAALLRNHIFASVFHASAEAMVTENAARLALMRRAEKSVDERLEEIRREISTVRQDKITHELMDIVIGHMEDGSDQVRGL